MHACVHALLCLTLCDSMDCSLSGSSLHGIVHARILEWVAVSFSRGSFWPRDQTHISCVGRQILYHWVTWRSPSLWQYPLKSSCRYMKPNWNFWKISCITLKLNCKTEWTLWERERVGRFGRMALTHVKYHVWNELPVQVRCTILDAWGWCTGTTQRDGMGREEGSGWETHVYLWRIHFDIWQN